MEICDNCGKIIKNDREDKIILDIDTSEELDMEIVCSKCNEEILC